MFTRITVMLTRDSDHPVRESPAWQPGSCAAAGEKTLATRARVTPSHSGDLWMFIPKTIINHH
jgi:hypothetical protein